MRCQFICNNEAEQTLTDDETLQEFHLCNECFEELMPKLNLVGNQETHRRKKWKQPDK